MHRTRPFLFFPILAQHSSTQSSRLANCCDSLSKRLQTQIHCKIWAQRGLFECAAKLKILCGLKRKNTGRHRNLDPYDWRGRVSVSCPYARGADSFDHWTLSSGCSAQFELPFSVSLDLIRSFAEVPLQLAFFAEGASTGVPSAFLYFIVRQLMSQ